MLMACSTIQADMLKPMRSTWNETCYTAGMHARVLQHGLPEGVQCKIFEIPFLAYGIITHE